MLRRAAADAPGGAAGEPAGAADDADAVGAAAPDEDAGAEVDAGAAEAAGAAGAAGAAEAVGAAPAAARGTPPIPNAPCTSAGLGTRKRRLSAVRKCASGSTCRSLRGGNRKPPAPAPPAEWMSTLSSSPDRVSSSFNASSTTTSAYRFCDFCAGLAKCRAQLAAYDETP